MKNIKITTIDAIVIANEIEELLQLVGYHVALGGSCLHKGGSFKDIDIFVYPHKKEESLTNEELVNALSKVISCPLQEKNHFHYDDSKVVYKGIYKKFVIDFFLLS